MTMTSTIEQDQLIEIAAAVWSSFLELSLNELEPSDASASGAGHSASATVHITGCWNGSVILACSTMLARRAAAAMFQTGEDDLDDGEVADAFGELANIIGGNLKCLLPEPSQLSLPTVSNGDNLVVTIPGAQLLQHAELECDGAPLSIAVWTSRNERSPAQQAELNRRTS